VLLKKGAMRQDAPMPAEPIAERSELYFRSGDARCHAWLYLPEAPSPEAAAPPVLVMAHGLGAVKTLRLGAFAERFQAKGYACLVFDYRHFGESEGEPRELLSIKRQRADWRAAIEFARSLGEVDPSRVVLWGTSFGGGHAIASAAGDGAVVAAVVQCPFTDGLASARQISLAGKARLASAFAKDQLARATGRPPVRVKVAARPGEIGLMDAPDVYGAALRLLEASGLREEDFRNDVPARVAVEIPLAAPGRLAKKIRCPILFCVCDDDSVAPAEATLRHAAKAPRGEIRRYPVGHFDIYVGKDFERVVADQLAFLEEHVPVPATGGSRPERDGVQQSA
jgi:pimeloyl-ACP methyl ester carboxylesterase